LRALAAADVNGAKIFGPTAGVIEAFLCDGGPSNASGAVLLQNDHTQQISRDVLYSP
jgi:hypothetical protein